MCFSATASFTAGAVLSVAGVYSLSQAKSRKVLPLAAIPFVFGLQQFSEGVVWKTLGTECVVPATNTYLIFANAVWPFLVPLAAYCLESNKFRRKTLLYLLVLGILTSAYALWHVLFQPYTAHQMDYGLGYWSSEPYFAIFPIAYAGIILGSLLISSRRYVNLLGIGSAIAWLIASYFYTQSFLSTWCFFSAMLSVLVIIQVKREK